MKLPLISVIIVTYNSESYLPACLKSIFVAEYSNLEIIIVDNCSKDKTVRIIKSLKKKVVPLFMDKNLGYAESNNLGVKKARGEFIFLLNPDTTVDKNIFSYLLKAFENPKIAVSQPAIFLMKERQKLNLTGKMTNFMGFDWVRDYGSRKVPQSGEIISFSGCGVMIRKEIFNKTKGFDPNFFMYYEDTDLSWRLRLFGYKLIFVPKAIMYHDYKYIPVESYLPLKNKLFLNERNRIMTIYKNYSTWTIILLLPAFLILEFCMLIFSISGGWFNEKLKGYRSIIKLRDNLNKDRLFVQRNRILFDRQITDDFKSTLGFEMYNNLGVRLFINPFLSFYWNIVKHLII